MSCYRISARAVPAGEVVEAVDHVHLQPAPREVAMARGFVRNHTPVVPEDVLDTVLLLTSELVTNAVIHARTPLEVGITVTDKSVVVTVHDENLNPTPDRGPREGGWGLGLVRSLADEWAMETHGGTEGKTAWFRVGRGSAGSFA